MNVLTLNSQVPPIKRGGDDKQIWSELREWKKELEVLNIDAKELVLFVDKTIFSWFCGSLSTYGISADRSSDNTLAWVNELEYLNVAVWENENEIVMKLHIYTPSLLNKRIEELKK